MVNSGGSRDLLSWARSVATGADARALMAREIALVPEPLRDALDLSRVRLIDRAHNPFALGKILVRGNDIYWPRTPRDFTSASVAMQSLLIHELAHVLQYATGRLTALGYLTRPENWRYRYEVREGAQFDDYTVEAQADLVQDWFLMRRGHPPAHHRGKTPTRDWLEGVVDFSLRT